MRAVMYPSWSAPGAVVPALAPEHRCPHGGRGGSSPAAASAPPSLSWPAPSRSDGISRGLLLPPLWGSRPSLQPAPVGPQSPLLPGSFPNPHRSMGPLVPGRVSWGPTLPTARACPLLKQPEWGHRSPSWLHRWLTKHPSASYTQAQKPGPHSHIHKTLSLLQHVGFHREWFDTP